MRNHDESADGAERKCYDDDGSDAHVYCFFYNITRKLFEYCLGVKIFVADLLVWLYLVCIDKRNIRMKYNMWCCDALY